MSSTRKIIRAFLASPGDLKEEREAIRGVVDEFNESWAHNLGYQVELIGWEETVSRFGRPQHLINEDLERCDLFLGMIWKKWGTPPDHGGKFTSGFEEEFELSMARREESGAPEISLFCKHVPDEYRADPGADLKKVLDFQSNVINRKKVLFQNFSTTRELERQVRKTVTFYVNCAKAKDEASQLDEPLEKRAQVNAQKTTDGDITYPKSPLSSEGTEFLEDLINRIKDSEGLASLDAGDIARFRLLANLISKPGNEEFNLGVHDINILYRECQGKMELGQRETRYLARLGLQHLTNENVPLWCWYSSVNDSHFNTAVFYSFAGANDNEKVAAISILTSLNLDFPPDEEPINRSYFITTWFSDKSSAKVRTAALGYLAKRGSVADLGTVWKEYERSDYGTSRSALECMLEILVRSGQTREAHELIFSSQFETINTGLLMSALEGIEALDNTTLLLGLEHRNSQVRLRTVKALRARAAIDSDMAERLTKDSDPRVRLEAVTTLSELGKPLPQDAIKGILVPPQTEPRRGLLALGHSSGTDIAAGEIYRQYQISYLKGLSDAELKNKLESSTVYDDVIYFALVDKHFRRYADELRINVDDRFSTYFEEQVNRLEAKFGDSPSAQDLVKKTRNLSDFICKELTRHGLDLLCKAQRAEDLHRIRANLRDGYTEASKLDASYLRKHGQWIDIPTLANAKGATVGVTILSKQSGDEFRIEVSKAIIAMGKKGSISDLLSIEMPAPILRNVIELCAESRFAGISREALLNIFNHDSEEVRKAGAIIAIRSLPSTRIKSILREYVDSENHRYYNVIHWLDLGASMSRSNAKKVALAHSK